MHEFDKQELTNQNGKVYSYKTNLNECVAVLGVQYFSVASAAK